MLSPHGFLCFIINSFFCLLHHYAFSSWFPLFHYQFLLLFVTSLCFLLMISFVSLSISFSVCCVTIPSLQGFHCFSICLRHCSVVGFDCLDFRLLRHHGFASRFLLVHSSSVCYVKAVFWTSIVSSSVLLCHSICFLLMISIISLSVCYVTVSSSVCYV